MRLAERSWLIPALQEMLFGYDQKDVEQRCERAKVSWAPVGKPIDLFTDEHLVTSGGLLDVFVSRFGEGDGKLAGLPALPVEFGVERTRPSLRNQPPRIGQHGNELLGAAGWTGDEIADFASRGIVRIE